MAQAELAEQRAYPRRDMQAPAYCQVGTTGGMHGEVLDCSGGGVFFHPEFAILSGEMTSDPELDVGETLMLEVGPLRTAVRVAWGGYSQHHQTHGYGLEYLISEGV